MARRTPRLFNNLSDRLAKKYMTTKTIDTNRDITPLIPSWVEKVVENKTYGTVKWNIKDIELYLSEKQKGGYISGNELREEMKDKNPVNLAFLQFFVDNPKLYPKEWKGKYIHGWGTIVQNRNGGFSVPFLFEGGGEVVLYWAWLGRGWNANSPALRFASIETEHLNIDTFEPSLLSLESRVEKIENWIENVRNQLL